MSLVLRRVTKDYEARGRPPHRAVDDVTLELEAGRFHTLLGPSGCGKTTLLRLVAGFEHATSGEIVHDGRRIDEVPPYRRGFPMVFQSYALFPHMSVADNVGYGLRVRRTPRAELEASVTRALELLGLTEQRDQYPGRLSGGQQQRVALARALVMEPRLILLDEPLSNLDAGLRVAMRGEIRALQRRLGITALYVTHDQEEALAISDVVIVMNAGRIEQVGTPADVFQRPATAFVARFMGCPNIVPVARPSADAVVVLGERYVLGDAFLADDRRAAGDPHMAGDARTAGDAHSTRSDPRSAAPGARAAVLLHDAIVLADDGRHHATVEEATFLGSRVQYRLRAADGTALVIERPASVDAAPLAAGDAVRFELRPERLHFLTG